MPDPRSDPSHMLTDGPTGGSRAGPVDVRGVLRRHRIFLLVLALGASLRVVAMLGYRPSLWYHNDSFAYVGLALRPQPHPFRPGGYGFFLWALRPFHSLTLVTAMQHLLGLAIAVLIYVLLQGRSLPGTRRQLPGWVAALAAAPVLLGAHQIQLEHLLLSDVLFTFLVVAAVAVALRTSRPGIGTGLAAGALLGLAAGTRTVGAPLLVLLVVFWGVRRAGFRAVTAAVLAGAAPIAAYAAWFDAAHGRPAMSYSGGVFLYARTATFADCARIRPPPSLRPLCPAAGPGQRPHPSAYVWRADLPLRQAVGNPFTPRDNALAREFAVRAIAAQPLDYARVVAGDVLRGFAWHRGAAPGSESYLFPATGRGLPADVHAVPGGSGASDARAYARGPAATVVVEPYAGFLRGYQRYVYLRGSLLAAVLAAGAAGMVAGRRRLGDPAMLPWAAAVTLIVTPVMVLQLSERYLQPAIALACLAAGLAARR